MSVKKRENAASSPLQMRVVDVKVAALVPYARNARTHSPEQVDQVAKSIREFGWTNPVLIDERFEIIAGHGRVLAAKQLGMTKVPCVQLSHLSEVQKRAYRLADNKLPLNAGWDEKLLTLELEALRDEGFDIGLTGFDPSAVWGPGQAEPDPDAVPPLPAQPRTKVGEVWKLGAHRLFVGDARSPQAYAQLLGKERVDVVWTDPPYNVDYVGKAGRMSNDKLKPGAYLELLRELLKAASAVMKPGAPIYLAHADTEGLTVRQAFAEVGLKLSGCLIWRKDSLVLGRSDYQWIHEPVLYGWMPGAKHRWYGGRKSTTVVDLGDDSPFEARDDGRWQVRVGDRILIVEGPAKVEELASSVVQEPRPKRSADHPTMKPVALIERMLRNSARENDLVLDCCAGSGSTLIAAHRMGMRARVIEIEAKFADVIVSRWETFTGKTATKAGT